MEEVENVIRWGSRTRCGVVGEYIPLGKDSVGLGGRNRIEWIVWSGFVKAAYVSPVGRIRSGVVRTELRICYFEASEKVGVIKKCEAA